MVNSRAKGAGAEREVAGIIQDYTGVKLVRNLEQTRSGGHDLLVHPDETGSVADAFRALAIECKRYNSVTPGLIKRWWLQAVAQAEPLQLQPILIYRADRQDWQAMASLQLINPELTRSTDLEYTATMSIQALCHIIRDANHE